MLRLACRWAVLGLIRRGSIARPCPRISALNAFLQKYRRCGELDGGGNDSHVWMACECGASIAQPIQQPESSSSQ
jgi:hypothetical protein